MRKLEEFDLTVDDYGFRRGAFAFDIGIGFDLVKMNLYPWRTGFADWDRVHELVASGEIKASKPATANEDALLELVGNRWYSFLSIDLSKYEHLKMQKSNLGKGDFCILELHVEPEVEGFGNLNNYKCEELQGRVLRILDRLSDYYGLRFEKGTVNLNAVEINKNLTEYIERDTLNFKYYTWLCTPFQFYLDENWKSENWHISKQGFDLGNYDLGLRSITTTLKIHLYDKSYQTQDENKHIVEMTPVTRVEIGIQKKNQIESHFPTANLMELNQNDVENAFIGLFEKYITDNLYKYHQELDDILCEYFRKIDMSDRKWKIKLIKFFARVQKELGYLCLNMDDLQRYVKLIPSRSVKAHAARIVRDIITEVEGTYDTAHQIIYYNKYNIDLFKNNVEGEFDYGPKCIEFALEPES